MATAIQDVLNVVDVHPRVLGDTQNLYEDFQIIYYLLKFAKVNQRLLKTFQHHLRSYKYFWNIPKMDTAGCLFFQEYHKQVM